MAKLLSRRTARCFSGPIFRRMRAHHHRAAWLHNRLSRAHWVARQCVRWNYIPRAVGTRLRLKVLFLLLFLKIGHLLLAARCIELGEQAWKNQRPAGLDADGSRWSRKTSLEGGQRLPDTLVLTGFLGALLGADIRRWGSLGDSRQGGEGRWR